MADAAERSARFRENHPGYYSTPARKTANNRHQNDRREDPAIRAARVTAERTRRLKRLYDITPEEYDTILTFQGGVCAICERPPKKTRLHVDHDHKTGEVRGLLCANCNRTLGERVSMEWLYSAHAYLDAFPSSAALGRVPRGVIGRIKTRRRKRRAA